MLTHDKLYEHYPFLKDFTVKFTDNENIDAALFYEDKTILVRRSLSDKKSIPTLLHEVQHIIQNYEGFETGSSVIAAKEQKIVKSIRYLKENGLFTGKIKKDVELVFQRYDTTGGDKAAKKNYRNTKGEIEAEITAKAYSSKQDPDTIAEEAIRKNKNAKTVEKPNKERLENEIRDFLKNYGVDYKYFSNYNIGRWKAIVEGWGELYDVIENQKSNNLENADHVVFSEETRFAPHPANLTAADPSATKISEQKEPLSGDQMVHGRVNTETSLEGMESTREGGFSMPQSPDRYDLRIIPLEQKWFDWTY